MVASASIVPTDTVGGFATFRVNDVPKCPEEGCFMVDGENDSDAWANDFNEVKETIARNLAAARSAVRLSQEGLAKAAGVSRATINQLEAAEADPRLSTLIRVAAALGLSPLLLVLGRDDLDEIVQAPQSAEAKLVLEELSAEDLDTMNRLMASGIGKKRMKAVGMGSNAAVSAGLAAGGLAGAAIGTVLAPGLGTAIGAALSSLWANRRKK